MRRINERYREFIEASADPAEARRRVVECARRHGTAAAARMSGAHRVTVRRLLNRADAGHPVVHDGGLPPLSPEDEARIIDARLANPTEGVYFLKKNRRVPYGYGQIFRVLHEVGMLRKIHTPTRDPDFWIRRNRFLLQISTIDFCLARVASLMGMTGGVANTGPPRRRLARAARKLEWWEKEKVRRERAEKTESH